MENIDKMLNELIIKLLTEGSAEFNKDGLNIKSSFDNGCLKIKASLESPVKDNRVEKLIAEFEKYVKSLSDEFFLEVAESFEGDKLKKIQDKLDTKNYNEVISGINEFMTRVKEIASCKVKELTEDISETEKELTELIEIRDSYIHVLNKKF